MLSLIFAVVFILLVILLSLIILASLRWRSETGEGQVQVVVLGDVGRSPRMQYHCLSLVQQDYKVELVGYGGSQLIQDLVDNSKLSLYLLPNVPKIVNSLPGLLRYIVKVLFQIVTLFWVVLNKTNKPSHVLLQTPPAIPSQFVMIIICLLKGSKLIIDYHNYSYTLMALSLGEKHPLVQITQLYEKLLSHFVNARLCVSDAMKRDLQKNWGVRSYVMYDRPPHIFQLLSTAKKHELFVKLAETEPVFRSSGSTNDSPTKSNIVRTAFSESTPTGIRLTDDRPFLLVSSTSWTEDEDFSILLKALEIYEDKAKDDRSKLPPLVCIITGKGPLRTYYEDLIKKKQLQKVSICTMWLSFEDYPALLASADLGVCLHKSSSGLDLPMKIVDMFGCGLPVCAIHFDCLHELLRDEHNGVVFKDHTQLAEQLQRLCRGFPVSNPHLNRFRDNLVSFHSLRWDHYWKLHVLPIFTGHL